MTSEPHLTSELKKPPIIVVQIIIWRLPLFFNKMKFPFIKLHLIACAGTVNLVGYKVCVIVRQYGPGLHAAI